MFRPGVYPDQIPLPLKALLYAALRLVISYKWVIDRLFLPLRKSDWSLYEDIHVISAIRLRRFPNLLKPRGYNDQCKWLMLFAQHPLMPQCVDKLRVRDYVVERVGEDYLVPLLAHGTRWSDVEPTLLSGGNVVLKCSHDSGSAVIVKAPNTEELVALSERFKGLQLREYGTGKGEWPYAFVEPNLLVEARLGSDDEGGAPDDIKVHCVNGEPRMVHIIRSRHRNPSQIFFSANGERLPLRVKPHRIQIANYDFDPIRKLVLPLARKLSEPFRYVRCDFYIVDNTPYFGEMTFFEESGLFNNRFEDEDLAEALQIPCVDPCESIFRTPDIGSSK